MQHVTISRKRIFKLKICMWLRAEDKIEQFLKSQKKIMTLKIPFLFTLTDFRQMNLTVRVWHFVEIWERDI